MNKRGIIVVLSGPSGVGKGTIRLELMKNPALRLKYSISMTTRKPRCGEVHGEDYYFVSEEEFNKNLESNNFLEHATFVNNRYGTPKNKVEELLNEGYNVFIEIDVQGAMQLKQNVPEDERVLIFLLPPSLEELEARIRGRKTEEEKVIQKRLNRAKEELTLQNEYDFCVVNDDIERAAKEISEIILKKSKDIN